MSNVSVDKELLDRVMSCLNDVYDTSNYREYNPNGADRLLCACCQEDIGEPGTNHAKDCAKMRSIKILQELEEVLDEEDGKT